jgi:nucleotide-binding universal stress UspA family protein
VKRLTVGVDGSGVASGALMWAAGLAVQLDAEVMAVNCFTHPYSEVSPEDRERLLAERKQALSEVWTAPAAKIGANVDSVVVEGDARDLLLSKAEADNSEMLVLGRIGAGGGPGFLHLGSVVEHAAHHTSIPLAVVPPGWSEAGDRIVVGVDGSKESLAAVSWVAEIAPALDATVVAVHVAEPYLEWTPADSPDNWRRDVEQHIEQWTAPLSESGVTVLPVAQRDLHPADGLLGVATARHGDMLVIGTRGVGGFAGLRAGGVALKVLHHASVPLILVPGK